MTNKPYIVTDRCDKNRSNHPMLHCWPEVPTWESDAKEITLTEYYLLRASGICTCDTCLPDGERQ